MDGWRSQPLTSRAYGVPATATSTELCAALQAMLTSCATSSMLTSPNRERSSRERRVRVRQGLRYARGFFFGGLPRGFSSRSGLG